MIVYRIARRPHVDLSGLGGLYAAGRWHDRGLPIIYASQNLETALLEIAVNNYLAESQRSGVVMAISIPDDAIIGVEDNPDLLSGYSLDAKWRSTPQLVAKTRAIGMKWLKSKVSLVLKVPSIVIDSPSAYNYLINPLHTRMSEVSYESYPLSFDQRLAPKKKRDHS